MEKSVGDDGSEGRTADHEVTIDVAAIDTVVEIVGGAVIIDRSDMVRDMHVSVIVVVIRVYVGGVGHSVSRIRAVAIGMTSGSRLVTIASVGIAFGAGTAYGLRLCLTLCRIAAFVG